MNLTFIGESLKFTKLKSKKAIRYVFLVIFIVNALALLYPAGDSDFSKLESFIYGDGLANFTKKTYLWPDPFASSVLSWDNVWALLAKLGLAAFNLNLSFLYGAIMLGDYSDKSSKESVQTYFRCLPQMLLFTLLLFIPYVFSIAAIMIPFWFLWVKISFTPLYLYEGKYNITTAPSESFYQTANITFRMFMSYILLDFVLNVPISLVMLILPLNDLGLILMTAFFKALSTVIFGRLLTLFYLYYAKINPRLQTRPDENVFDVMNNLAVINSKISDDDDNDDFDDFDDFDF